MALAHERVQIQLLHAAWETTGDDGRHINLKMGLQV